MNSRAGSRRIATVFLLAILAAGLAVRLLLIWHDYPRCYHPDEPFYAQEAMRLAGGRLPTYYARPTFYLYFLALADATYFSIGRVVGKFASLRDFQLHYVSHFTDFTLLARLVSALFSWLTIGVVYAATRRLYGMKEGLTAAALVALSPLHVSYAQQGVTDATMTFWAVLVLLPSIGIMKRGRLASYLWAGGLVGLATASKYPAVLGALSIVAAHFLRKDREGLLRWLFQGKLLAAAGTVCVGFLAGCPFAILDYGKFMRDVFERIEIINSPWLGLNPYSTGFEFYAREVFLRSEGIAFSAVVIAACVLLITRHRRQDIFLLAFPIPFLLYVGAKRYAADRYIMQAVVHLEIAAAVWLVLLARFCVRVRNAGNPERRWPVCAVLAALALVVICQPACNVAGLLSDKASMDPRTTAVEWIEQNIPAESRLLVDYTSYAPPLAKREGGVRDQILHFCGTYGLSPESALVRRHLAVVDGRPEYVTHMLTYPTSPALAGDAGPEIPADDYDYAIVAESNRLMILNAPDYASLRPFKRFYESLATRAQLVRRFENRRKDVGAVEIYSLKNWRLPPGRP